MGHALSLLILPGCTALGPAGKVWVRSICKGLGQSCCCSSQKFPERGLKGGTLAESLPIEFSRMVASISLALFSLMFRPVLHWTESGAEGEIAQGQYLDELLVSQVALYKLATAP